MTRVRDKAATADDPGIIKVCAWCCEDRIKNGLYPFVLAGGALNPETDGELVFQVDHGRLTGIKRVWHGETIETYILSHGICPECAGKIKKGEYQQ